MLNGRLLRIQFQDAVTAWILDPVAEHGGTVSFGRRALHHLAKARAVKDIVAEDQRAGSAVDEFLADQKCLGDAVGRRVARHSGCGCPTGCRRRASASKRGTSGSAVMIRISRMPASISVVSG